MKDCQYNYKGEWYTKEQLAQKRAEEESNLDYFEDDLYDPIPQKNNLGKIIEYKEILLTNHRNRLGNIDKEIKDYADNLEKVKELTREKNQITERIEGNEDYIGLEAEMEKIKDIKSPAVLKFYLDSDLKRLKDIINNPRDTEEAESIIDFLKALGNFDVDVDHPIFGDLKDSPNILPQVKEMLVEYHNMATAFENDLKTRKWNNFSDFIKSNKKLKEVAPDATPKSLLEPRPDINWIQEFAADITMGNGLLPQVLKNEVDNAFELAYVKAKAFENRIEELQPKVSKKLKDLGYGISTLGILGVNGVSWELFRAKTKEGLKQDRLIERVYSNFYSDRSDMLSKYYNLLKKSNSEDISKEKKQEFATQAYELRKQWYQENTIDIDANLIPELHERYSDYTIGYNEEKAQQNKTNLINILGVNGYNEFVLDQKKKIDEYLAQRSLQQEELEFDKLEIWDRKNSPFIYSDSSKRNEEFKNHTLKYNIFVPKQDSGYYNEDFKTIDNDSDLKEFYDLLREITDNIYHTLPYNKRQSFFSTTIPALKKAIAEIVFDPDLNGLEKVIAILKEFYDVLRLMFGENIEDGFSTVKTNPITGKPEYTVNDTFIQSNKGTIDNLLAIELGKIYGGVITPDSVKDRQSFKSLDYKVQQNLLENTAMSEEQFLNTFGDNIIIKKVLRDAITDRVVKDLSFDLPKIMKMFSFLTAEYEARQEVLPMIKLGKEYYEGIEKVQTDKKGKTLYKDGKPMTSGNRDRAIGQFESYFNRVVLGNYSSKNEFGNDTFKSKLFNDLKLIKDPKSKLAFINDIIERTSKGRILSTRDKELLRELKAAIENVSNSDLELPDKIKALENLAKIEGKIGKRFTATAFVDSIMNFIRAKSLGWNVSSSVTNLMEGQIANFRIAESGDYFTPENIYYATSVMKFSFLKNLTGGKVNVGDANKASVLMKRYRILQDASNELQKATTKTTFSRFKALSLYEINRRVEFLNQSPLMIAILMDEKIKDVNGNESSVWESLDSKGNLKEGFRTDENIKNWEESDGNNYIAFKSKTLNAIINAQGDYHQLGGYKGSETMTGKALGMFKRFMPRQFYQRFAEEQDILDANIKGFKGSYRSHTKVTAALQAGLAGFAFAGPVGFVVGGSAGYLIGSASKNNSDLSVLKELSIVSKNLALNLAKIPVNTLAGKQVIENNYGALKENMSERDFKNLKMNLIETSLLLGWIGFTLLTKALLWDDEDEDDDARRKMHNLLSNRFMQLSSQATMYINPAETYRSTIGSVAVVRFFEDVSKLTKETQDMLEGRDTLAGGPNAGESAFQNQFYKTFAPGLFKDLETLGFGSAMERQFQNTPFDPWFKSNETKAKEKVRSIRAKYRLELDEQGVRDVEKQVNKKFPPKKKGQTYEELLNDYDKVK